MYFVSLWSECVISEFSRQGQTILKDGTQRHRSNVGSPTMTAGPPGKPMKEEKRMTMAKPKPKKVLDQEWVILMRAARELGLKKEEVQAFLRQHKNRHL